MQRLAPSPYNRVGEEYYLDTHTTCRDFEWATERALAECSSILEDINTSGTLLDVGSGAGLASRYLGAITGKLVQLDISAAMLQQADGLRVSGDALALPFANESFDTVTAFLYDPFNVPEFEQEIVRVLKPGGTFLGTLPSFNWASALRYSQDLRNTEQTNNTYFRLQDGTRVEEPSFVTREEDIRYNLWVAGFDTVETYGIPASYAGANPSKAIYDTAWLVDDMHPLERLDIITVVKATHPDQSRQDYGRPPGWVREVLAF